MPPNFKPVNDDGRSQSQDFADGDGGKCPLAPGMQKNGRRWASVGFVNTACILKYPCSAIQSRFLSVFSC